MYLFYFTLVIIPCCVMMSPSVMKQMKEHVSLWVLISRMRSLTWRTGFNLSVIGGSLLVCCCGKNILTRQLTQEEFISASVGGLRAHHGGLA